MSIPKSGTATRFGGPFVPPCTCVWEDDGIKIFSNDCPRHGLPPAERPSWPDASGGDDD